MKTLFIIAVTAAITWYAFSVIHGLRDGAARLWLISAVKAPGRMALMDIQADMNAGRCVQAKAKIDAFVTAWRRFESGANSFRGSGLGDIMAAFSTADTSSDSTTKQ